MMESNIRKDKDPKPEVVEKDRADVEKWLKKNKVKKETPATAFGSTDPFHWGRTNAGLRRGRA